MGFFAFIFVFLLGGVVSLVGAAFAIHYTLLVVERKTDSQRQKLAKEVSAEESQRAVQLLIPELKTKVRFSFSTAPWPKEAAKRMQHTVIVLKANMFFHFVDEKRDACNIARVDNCAVDIMRQDGKPKFNKKNYLKITSPAGNLFPDAATSGGTTSKNAGDTCYIKFFNGKDLELWYYALKAATSLTIAKEVKEVEQLQAQQRYFAHLTAVANNSAEVNADWTNALLGRIFWGVHSHPVFLTLITEKLQKKMAKLKKPKFVESISVTDVGFGPNLPLFSNIKILSVSPQGSLAFDGDIYYHGGFNLMIDINLRIDLPIGGVSVEVPIRASVLVKAFAGRGHIQVAPPPAKRAWIGFYGEPRVDLDVKIEVGKNLSLVNIPSIANIVINKIKQQLIKKLVLPAMDDWPLPHIPSTKTAAKIIEDTPAGSEKDGRPGALLASAAEASTTASSLKQSSSASSPVLTRVSSQPERSSFPGATSSSSSLSTSSSSVSTKRHSVAAMPGHSTSVKAPQPITVRTRTSPRDRVTKEQSSSAGNPPPLPARTQSALTQALNQPESPLVETGSPVLGTYKPLMAMPSTSASPLPTRDGANTITSLQLPSSPPRGQWNSTDEWYQNSLLALRDRDDSDSDGSDREDQRQRAERERKQKEDKEREDKERKSKEDKEKEEQEKQQKLKDKEREEREKREKDEQERKAREEKERLEKERAKDEEERVRREREAKSEVIKSPLTEDTPGSSEDMREIEQFTEIGKSEDDRKRELEERKEREEAERKEREAKEQQEKEREQEEKERLAQQEQRAKRQKEEQERQEKERSGLVTKHEVFSDPLSSSLNNPIMDEIFGSADDSPPPRRQATFDGNIPSPLLPDAPHRRRSGSLTITAVTPKPPALPPRAHDVQKAPSSLPGGSASQPRAVQQPASKFRTTSHMFEDFDFSFPSAGPSATGSPTPAPHAATPPTASFLGLNTPVTSSSSSPPSPPRPSNASNTDNLFSFSPPASSSTSSTSSTATKPGAPPKKAGGLFNLDMDDLFNKVEKQHHLVEKFKAAKTRAQNAINDWNHTNPDQDL